MEVAEELAVLIIKQQWHLINICIAKRDNHISTHYFQTDGTLWKIWDVEARGSGVQNSQRKTVTRKSLIFAH